MNNNAYAKITSNPKFQELVSKRSTFAWALSIVMLTIYFGFILVIAYAPGILGAKIGTGVATWGFPIGVGVIISAIVLTGIYVWKANSEFDELTRQILEECK